MGASAVPEDPSGLRVVVLGAGNAFSRRDFSTCFALQAEGRWLLIDCPHPLRRMLGALEEATGLCLDIDDFDGIVLTHLHADHSSGLESVGFYSRYESARRLSLLAHRDVSAGLWDHHLAAGMASPLVPWWADTARSPHDRADRPPRRETHHLSDFYDSVELVEGEVTHFGPFAIEVRPTLHVVDTTALRITAGGVTFAYSADTAFDPNLILWLAAADRFVHEVGSGIHTPYECLAALPEAVLERMWLAHYGDELDRDASVIECLAGGQIHDLVPSPPLWSCPPA